MSQNELVRDKDRDNVPRLRFPEFTDKWQNTKLGSTFERVTRKNKENNQNILTISAQSGLVSQEKFFSKLVAAKDVTNYYLLHKNDYAYNKSYSKGYPMGAIKRLVNDDKGVVSTLYICFTSTKGGELFFDQYFESGRLNSELEKIAQEGARNHGLLNMSVGDFFDIELVIPSIPEQQKIASFLTAIDARIAKQQQKLSLLKDYKKGVMQKLFTQQIRFKDENGEEYPEWEEKRLGELVSIKTGKKDVNQGNPSGKYPFFTCAREHTYSDVFSFEGEAIMIAGNGEVGQCTYYDGKFEAYQRTYVLQDFKVPAKYLFIYLREAFQSFAESQKQQGSMPYIKLSTLQNFAIPIQGSQEQQKIAELLTSIDDKIKAEENLLTSAKVWKKGLLQRMFV